MPWYIWILVITIVLIALFWFFDRIGWIDLDAVVDLTDSLDFSDFGSDDSD